MRPNLFFHFRDEVEKFGIEQAKRSLAIEDYTASEITKLLEIEKLVHTVDLVSAGRTTLLFSQENVEDANADFSAANDAGVDLGGVDWISKEDMEAVCVPSFTVLRNCIASFRFSATERHTLLSKFRLTTYGPSN
jgi:hypothetical protein